VSATGMNKCSCVLCGENIEYPPEYEGVELACPHCGQATLLKIPAAPTIKLSASAVPAPPAMGSVPPPSSPSEQVPASGTDPETKDQHPSPICENCGAGMMPEDKVCVECGHRRSSVRKWTNAAIFRLVAAIVILGELAVLGLQWTTEGKPFGLRKRTRHAVLVKVGLAEEVDPVKQAAMLKANASANVKNIVKDPDLKLKSHEKATDKDNGSIWIKGVVENVSQYRYLGVRVRFKLKDKDGQVIPEGEVSAYQQAIEPGKEWSFKVLMLDPDAVGYEPILPVAGQR
tara:strand:+ start:1642 stop:2502 length:861 start_codon:yes stop_codon:yes gene_type:complete